MEFPMLRLFWSSAICKSRVLAFIAGLRLFRDSERAPSSAKREDWVVSFRAEACRNTCIGMHFCSHHSQTLKTHRVCRSCVEPQSFSLEHATRLTMDRGFADSFEVVGVPTSFCRHVQLVSDPFRCLGPRSDRTISRAHIIKNIKDRPYLRGASSQSSARCSGFAEASYTSSPQA